MKEYLAMSGYFIGNVTINADGQICDDKYFRGSTDIAEDYYEPICHAINSHDELVEMNKELIDIINRVIDTSKELEGKAGASSWTDGYKQCAIDTGSALSEMIDKYKSKGGAA